MLSFNQLKKSYVQIKTLHDSSGFGWDDFKQVVTASVKVWGAFLAVCIYLFNQYCLLIDISE